jgi:hypothetical protein
LDRLLGELRSQKYQKSARVHADCAIDDHYADPMLTRC